MKKLDELQKVCRVVSVSSCVVPNSPPFRSGFRVENLNDLTFYQRHFGRCRFLVIVEDDCVIGKVSVPRFVDSGTTRWRNRESWNVVSIVDGRSTCRRRLATGDSVLRRCQTVDSAVAAVRLLTSATRKITLKNKNIFYFLNKLAEITFSIRSSFDI